MEFKDVAEVLGISGDIKTKEDLNAAVSARFVTREDAEREMRPRISQSFAGEQSKVLVKAFGIDATEVKDLSLKDLVSHIADKQKEKFAELEKQAGQGGEEKYTKLKGEYDKVLGDVTRFKTDNETLIKEKETLITNHANELKGIKIGVVLANEKAKLSFKDGMTAIEQTGFDTLIGSKYKLDIDEQNNLLVTDKDGKQIAHKSKTGVYLGLADVLQMEAEENNLLRKNNLDPNQTVRQTQHQQQQPDKPRRTIHPNALNAVV